jgi:hypothetical protein
MYLALRFVLGYGPQLFFVVSDFFEKIFLL